MNNINALIIGVVSGILTSAIIYLIVILFNRVFIPWYRQLIYRGVVLAGTWEEAVRFNPEWSQHTVYVIRQSADQLCGDATVSKFRNGKLMSTEMFVVTGTLADRFVQASLQPKDPKRLAASTRLLEVVGDGARLVGCTAWYDANSARVASLPSVWVRQGSRHDQKVKLPEEIEQTPAGDVLKAAPEE